MTPVSVIGTVCFSSGMKVKSVLWINGLNITTTQVLLRSVVFKCGSVLAFTDPYLFNIKYAQKTKLQKPIMEKNVNIFVIVYICCP